MFEEVIAHRQVSVSELPTKSGKHKRRNCNLAVGVTKMRTIDALLWEVLTHKTADMLVVVSDKLKKFGYKSEIAKEWVYAPGRIPVLLVAHVDTVHDTPPEQLFWDCGSLTSPQGLGADDRAGVYGLLALLSRGYRPHILFTDGEEKGCIGAKACATAIKSPSVRMMIELDRRGEKDCVFYSCDSQECEKYSESFGFVKAFGSSTDIAHLMPEWGIAGVNLSIGYYNQHSKQERLSLSECNNTINRVSRMLDKPPKDVFKYVKKECSYTPIKYVCHWCAKSFSFNEIDYFNPCQTCTKCAVEHPKLPMTNRRISGNVYKCEVCGWQKAYSLIAKHWPQVICSDCYKDVNGFTCFSCEAIVDPGDMWVTEPRMMCKVCYRVFHPQFGGNYGVSFG